LKKLFFSFTVIAMLLLLSVTAFAFAGDGSAETPFVITNQAELELVTDFPDCHFVLANDITLEGTWIPLCKQTSSEKFTGVFDGAGYTISNLLTDGTEGGLFRNNNGTIKNLKVAITEEGMTGSGTIAYYNYGTILNCLAEGNISGNFSYMGGICAYNSGKISGCKFEGNIENTSTSGYTGGICGFNSNGVEEYLLMDKCAVIGNITGKSYTGGICGYNYEKIADCYYIGEVNSASSYKGGIVGYSNYVTSGSYPYTQYYVSEISNCYAVPTFNSAGYGITGYSSSASKYPTITSSYYDKTISGLTSTSYGTPKSTAAMKMKQTYTSGSWDFDTVWAIDAEINNGYPYLQWEYPVAEEKTPYTINSVKITDMSGTELGEIPTEGFYLEVNATKNDNTKNSDCLIVAVYDENGGFIDLKFMRGTYFQNQDMTFGTIINKTDKTIGSIKGFVWDSAVGMMPLSNVVEINN